MTERSVRTTQLRRYRIRPEHFADYVGWWTAHIPGLRAAAGFTIEFAYANPEKSEFFWAVSTDGDAEDFRATEKAYADTPERHKAFESLGDWIDSADSGFVTEVAGWRTGRAAGLPMTERNPR
jgi:hypothetical protein